MYLNAAIPNLYNYFNKPFLDVYEFFFRADNENVSEAT